ncbi:TPA: hypothetical protein HA265_07510 [Candidatus Woesearchaeota archaeon]|nr:hypothetical protein [Candidatus Woesearchaeota archaeon]
METIHDFMVKFTERSLPDIHELRNRFYQTTPDILEVMKTADANLNREPELAGLFLGEMKGKVFRPSLALLEELGRISDQKVVIDDNAEWLFLCGRDVFGKSVLSSEVKSGLALITNRRDEVLGLGNVLNLSNKENKAITNLMDRGDYLRREMTGRRKG